MRLAEMTEHFAYADWANERMLQAVTALTDEQVNRDLGSSFHSIRATVAHVAGAEWLWLRRWTGPSPSAFPAWVKTAGVADLVARFREIERERGAFLGSLTDADLAKPVSFTLLNGHGDVQMLEAQMLHVVNHSTYHRGQVAGMIRQVGGTPVSTDLIQYHRQKGV